MEIAVKTPPDFNFHRTVLSHGWCALLPFELDRAKWRLTRVLDCGQRQPVTVHITNRKSQLRVTLSRRVGKAAAENIVQDVRHMLRLDDDFAGFYSAMAEDADFAWIAQQGAGRLLRSPTVFEDLVKMICTTNCSWALTEKMVTGLVNALGKPAGDGRRAFPTATAMAKQSVDFYRDKVRAGYRAPYLVELARRVAARELDVEAWLVSKQMHRARRDARYRHGRPAVNNSPLPGPAKPTSDLLKEMKAVKGVGNYAAENLLKLVGRYDGLALDSWTRAQFARVRNDGRSASDKKILRFYSRFNEWRGLALWCDMTRHWLDSENIANW